MKLSNIKKLTSQGNYTVSINLRYLKKQIEEWTNEDDEFPLQINPDFQRGYVWTEKQQIAYVEFLLRGGESQPILFNHPGWLSSFEGDFVLVDGKQRLTSILQFIDNKLTVFGKYVLNDFEDKMTILRSVNVLIRVNNLATRKEVLTWYLELNSGGTIHTDSELNKVRKLLKEEL